MFGSARFQLVRLARLVREIAFPVGCAVAVGWFALLALNGQHGLVAYLEVANQTAACEAVLAEARAERVALEARIAGLGTRAVDADLLDERARAQLRLVHPDDVVVSLEARAPRPAEPRPLGPFEALDEAPPPCDVEGV